MWGARGEGGGAGVGGERGGRRDQISTSVEKVNLDLQFLAPES